MKRLELKLGSTLLAGGRCRFCVWAPFAESVEVHVLSPQERMEPLRRDRMGYHCATLEGIEPGALYLFRLDGSLERPDPASRFQPQGVNPYPGQQNEDDNCRQRKQIAHIHQLHLSIKISSTMAAATGCLSAGQSPLSEPATRPALSNALNVLFLAS